MGDKNVKGSMLIDYVRMIRRNKTIDWKKHFEPEDWDIINSTVLPSSWYPFKFYYRCSQAVFKELAKSNFQATRISGQQMAKRLFETIYKSLINGKSTVQGLKNFVTMYSGFFNFSTLTFKSVDPMRVRIQLDYNDQSEATEAYCHHMIGIFEAIVQMTGGKNGNVVLAAKQWLGAPNNIFDITWA